MSTLKTNQLSNLASDFVIDVKEVQPVAEAYTSLGAYGAGLVFNSYIETFTYAGGEYRPLTTLALPYTTTGAGAGEIASFRGVGDALLRSDLAATGGAALVGATQLGAGAVSRTVQSKLRDSVSVRDFGGLGGANDDTAAVQAAVTYCIENNKDLEFPDLHKITSPINVDRLVDGASYDSYFTMYSNNGGGVFVDSAISMFTSSFVYAGVPNTQLIRWNGIRFVSSSTGLAAYVMDGNRFLRSVFESCSFSKIKCLTSASYVQSIYFHNCNVRRWSGDFFNASPQGYDIQVIGGLYEAGSGSCFVISSPIGCKFITQIEGVSGTALQINGAQGVDISSYFEANGLDMDCRTGGLSNFGINIHGSYFSNSTATYTVKWGVCKGCVSQGNWHTNNMHDLLVSSIVAINDWAQTNISNTGGPVSHNGYTQGNTGSLVIRGSNSASYTVSGQSSRFTRSGNRVDVNFVCTLTSNATNPADNIFIISGIGFDASFAGPLCGQIEVVGSTINNGVSPLYLSSAIPVRAISSLAVIPSNVSGATWTVRGIVSYEAAS